MSAHPNDLARRKKNEQEPKGLPEFTTQSKKLLKEEILKHLDPNPNKRNLVLEPPKTMGQILKLIEPIKQIPTQVILSFTDFSEWTALNEEFAYTNVAPLLGELLNSGHKSKEFHTIKAAALKAQNDFKFLYLVAVCLQYGFGCAKNRALAYEIHKTLDAQNYALSSLALSHSYETGEFGVIDLKRVVELRKKAYITGSDFFMVNFRMGLDIYHHRKNFKEALKFLTKAFTRLVSAQVFFFAHEKQLPGDMRPSILQARPMVLSYHANHAIVMNYLMTQTLDSENDSAIKAYIDVYLSRPEVYTDKAEGQIVFRLVDYFEKLAEKSNNKDKDDLLVKTIEIWSRILEKTQKLENFEKFAAFIRRHNNNALNAKIKELCQRAEKDAAQAQKSFILGELKRHGIGFTQNLSDALPHYINALKLGSHGAKVALVHIFSTELELLDFDLAKKLIEELKNSSAVEYGILEKELGVKLEIFNLFKTPQLDFPDSISTLIFDFSWDKASETASVQKAHRQELCKVYQQNF